MVTVVQLVRASDCGSECRGFESLQSPKEILNNLWIIKDFLFSLTEQINPSHETNQPISRDELIRPARRFFLFCGTDLLKYHNDFYPSRYSASIL